MAPERSPKRQKTLSSNDTPSNVVEPSQIPLPPDTSSLQLSSSPDPTATPSRSSFFASWSRKAPPITQVARESIRSASSIASDIASSVKDAPSTPKSVRSPSLAMTLGRGQSSRASLADATTTMVNAEVKSPSRNSKLVESKSTSAETPKDATVKVDDSAKETAEEITPNEQPSKVEEVPATATQQEARDQRSGWLGWLAKGDGAVDQSKDTSRAGFDTVTLQTQNESASGKPQIQDTPPTLTSQETSQSTTMSSKAPPSNVEEAPPTDEQANRRSWLPFWSTEGGGPSKAGSLEVTLPTESQVQTSIKSKEDPPASMPVDIQKQDPTMEQAKNSVVQPSTPPSLPHDGNKASAWAFWSRERKANDSTASVDKPHQGEIAVSDTPSQNQPRKASISVPKEKQKEKQETKKPETKKAPEPGKSVSGTITAKTDSSSADDTVSIKSHKKRNSKNEAVVTKAETSTAAALAVEPTETNKPASTRSTKTTHNLLLPSLHATLKPPETPSLLLRLASLLYVTKQPDFKHLSLVKEPPRIKNALAIGVHGYFPATLLRSVLGQPTGTSIKFADMAAKSIRRWTVSHGYECQVKTAALEGEGKIAERVELLWKLLLNWIDEIRKSDFVMIACHSQGVPVATMLVAKLIQFGCVSSARVCICAMAGVNMGPFQEYKSRWIGGSAAELFDFTNPASRVSMDYVAALDVVLKFGVRLTYIGSMDDQLVSLESSIFSPISHPHIFRAVFIDSRVHAPNFLSHLVGFALKLRNLGVRDHGLIRELSSPLAGSLYTGEGHSRIYDDDAVYDLAVAFALETNEQTGIPISQNTSVSGGSNPYILPFAMRGILEEDFVKNELQTEASDLLKEFDEWKPTSKVLKDVKFRLEGIRSRL